MILCGLTLAYHSNEICSNNKLYVLTEQEQCVHGIGPDSLSLSLCVFVHVCVRVNLMMWSTKHSVGFISEAAVRYIVYDVG